MPAEAGHDPEEEQPDQHVRLEHEVDQHHPEHPQRSPATGQERRDQRGADQPDRQAEDDDDGQPDHRRREHDPAEPARRQHVSPAARRGRQRSRRTRARSGRAPRRPRGSAPVVGARSSPLGQDVDAHAGRHGGHVPGEAVPAGDLERDRGDLPRAPRHRERPLDPADLDHVDRGRAVLDRSADRDRVHQAAVEEVLAVDLDRRVEARARRRTRARHRPAGPWSNQCSAARSMLAAQHSNGTARSSIVDVAEVLGQQRAQRVGGLQRGPGPGDRADLPDRRAAPDRAPAGLATAR